MSTSETNGNALVSQGLSGFLVLFCRQFADKVQKTHQILAQRRRPKFDQVVHNPLCSVDGRHHQCVLIAFREIDLIPSPSQQESEKQSLRSSVPFSEWVQHI